MSSITWTPDALLSKARHLKASRWRVVEAQAKISTMKLVDTLDEQARLEELLESSKPKKPKITDGLHYLLATPFRYQPEKYGFRFRRVGDVPGVFYCSEKPETAMAETMFYRWKFFKESPATLFPKNPTQVTCFSVDVDTQQALDLTDEVFDADKALFESKADYSYCQKIAATARQAGIEAITFRSVRDVRGGGKNTALLTPDAFKGTAPTATHTWYLLLRETGISAASDFPKKSMALSANELNDLMI